MSQSVAFSIFDKETGTIKRSGICPEKMLGSQARQGESIYIGLADELTQCITVSADGTKTVATRETPKDAGALIQLSARQTAAARLQAAGATPELAARLAAKVSSRQPKTAVKAPLSPAESVSTGAPPPA